MSSRAARRIAALHHSARDATARAAHLPDVSVHLDGSTIPGAIVQSVYVLGDQGKGSGLSVLKRHKRQMACIGLRFFDDPTAPVVPLPHQSRIARKRPRSRKLLRPEVAPQAARVAKGRDAVLP
jgi:hypothetical protein